jgi:hypothetical protein
VRAREAPGVRSDGVAKNALHFLPGWDIFTPVKLCTGNPIMISHVLVFVLMAAAPPSGLQAKQTSLVQARQGYAGCLGTLLRSKLKEKVEPDAFNTTLGGSCKTEEVTFRNAAVSADVAAGTSRATAEEGANFEISDMVANTRERYSEYTESHTEPR